MMKRIPSTLVWLIVTVMALVPGAVMAQSTSVTDAHIQQINQQFAQKGVPTALSPSIPTGGWNSRGITMTRSRSTGPSRSPRPLSA